ncbi:hypothetical protein F2P56_011413 [Juglans regia]|uniref:Uncharacterized protein LOC108997786 n=2 Tax=Juglans regia TaxID=51240 RepID=A0A2I4FDJ1_JUGRE|nr:uncharacterized protein LOC108997786 [Juglans regia]KAF5470927.1 hypothetical protein F2P56_011413 [Juglans regia]
MIRSRIPQHPKGVTNQENQILPTDGGLPKAIRLLVDMLRQQQQQQQQQQAHVPRPEVRGCLYEKFLFHPYPNFSGIEELLKAEKWIIDLERTYEICGCIEKQKLLVKDLGSLVALSWERFKEKFDNRFFPDSVKQLKTQEFVILTQGGLTVEQYAAKFIALGSFAPHLISTQRMQAQKFQV